jgi:hypothetical protein
MRRIYKILPIIPLFLIPLKTAFAAEIQISPCPPGTFSGACTLGADQFSTIIGTFVQAAFVMAVIIALVYLIYGAIRWIMSQGDKSKVTDARNHIVAAVIGLVIVFLSYLIINIILKLFFNISITDIRLPNGILPATH